ncbi:MAG: ATP-grasp domain-containing protein [Betaproteobacteria bacterium]
MAIPVLLAATATQYIGTARIPGALAANGFDVSLLAPRETLAETSRHIGRIEHLSDDTTPRQWAHAFAAMVEAVSPRIVLACDDTAQRLLQAIALSPPDDMPPTLRLRLAALVRASLGAPEHYRTSVDKTLLPPAAAALGIRVPPYAVVSEIEELVDFSGRHGFPVVLKRAFGAAGEWVEIANDRRQLAAAHAKLASAVTLEVEGAASRSLLAQAHVSGVIRNQNVAAWQGQMLAGFVREKMVAHPPPMGPSTVNRYLHSAETQDFAERLVRGLGMSGLFGIEFIADRDSGAAYLLEINRRITPGTPTGALVGVDLCAALRAVIDEVPNASRTRLDDGEEHVIAQFPQEWLRDPGSAYLRDCRVDAPWNDPRLFAAMLALRPRPQRSAVGTSPH